MTSTSFHPLPPSEILIKKDTDTSPPLAKENEDHKSRILDTSLPEITHGGDQSPPFEKIAEKENSKINWNHIISVSSSESESVFFVETDSKYPKMVVKGTYTMVQEIFALYLAEELSLNVPQHFVIQFAEKESYDSFHENMESKADDEATKRRLQKGLNRPFILIMEHINGTDIFALTGNEKLLNRFLGTREPLHQLGGMLLFDVLINNWDRLPLIWDNDGNGANFLFTFDESDSTYKVYAIDQAITTIKEDIGPAREKYLDRVKELVADILNPEWSPKKSSLDPIRSYFEMITGYTISPEGLEWIREGMISLMEVVARRLTPKRLNAIYQEVKNICIEDKEDIFASGLEAVDPHFVEEVIRTFSNKQEVLYHSLTKSSKFK